MTLTKSARKALRSLFIGAAMVVIAAPALAIPTQYAITFSGGSVTPTGSFVYDPDVPAFSDFIVMWNGLTFDLTTTANNPILIEGTILHCRYAGPRTRMPR